MHRSRNRQRRQGLPNGMTIDAEPRRKGGFRRQLVARAIQPLGNLGPDGVGDGFPDRRELSARGPLHRRGEVTAAPVVRVIVP